MFIRDKKKSSTKQQKKTERTDDKYRVACAHLPAVCSAARRNAARFPTTAVKPLLMAVTEHWLLHTLHFRKNKRVSLVSSVSDERHVWHVTYSSANSNMQ